MAKREPRTIFGRRLRDARLGQGIPQDRLGVAIGLDETIASARVSRYETGTHAPPYDIAVLLAKVLKLQVAYFYADDDDLAALILTWNTLTPLERTKLLDLLHTDEFSSNLHRS